MNKECGREGQHCYSLVLSVLACHGEDVMEQIGKHPIVHARNWASICLRTFDFTNQRFCHKSIKNFVVQNDNTCTNMCHSKLIHA